MGIKQFKTPAFLVYSKSYGIGRVKCVFFIQSTKCCFVFVVHLWTIVSLGLLLFQLTDPSEHKDSWHRIKAGIAFGDCSPAGFQTRSTQVLKVWVLFLAEFRCSRLMFLAKGGRAGVCQPIFVNAIQRSQFLADQHNFWQEALLHYYLERVRNLD